MGVMSIREFNANTSAAVAKVEAGESFHITKDGKVIAEIRPKRVNRMHDPKFVAARERMLDRLKQGIPGLKAPFTYEESTER
jgi:antitoxin (DNA-binding transcriptional repressor) of toxin-antitoxin stability system